MTPQHEWGAIARAVRTTRGLTQEEVAGMVGVTQPAISLIERGVGSREIRRGVAKALGIRV